MLLVLRISVLLFNRPM